MITYTKFVPRLLDLTKERRGLLNKNYEFIRTENHTKAFSNIKK